MICTTRHRNLRRTNTLPVSCVTTVFYEKTGVICKTGPCRNNAFMKANIQSRRPERRFFSLFFFCANARPPSALAKCITKTTHRASNAAFTTAISPFIAQLLSRKRRTYLLLSILKTQSRFQASRYVKSLLPTPLSVPSPFHGRK